MFEQIESDALAELDYTRKPCYLTRVVQWKVQKIVMQDMPVTEAESKIMEALWASAPVRFRDIARRVHRVEDWSPKTIQTLIGRLVGKGMVQRETDGRGYLYSPSISREEFVRSKSRHFIERVFSGRVAPLVAAFTETGALEKDDLKALRALVDSLEEQSPGSCDND